MAADELRRQADSFVDLYDLMPEIQREGQHREDPAIAVQA
jgi:hypothetical protein